MPNRKKADADDAKQEKGMKSSHGENSTSVTPKDVPSGTAASKDVVERKIASDDPEERNEEQLDDAVEMTFPASDPIAIPTPEKAEKHSGRQH
ncbi:hypothetical protein SAMN06265795_101257 [Noviherbaspirillum humi]|uniref:Uncharacterized protein n=1 Tax=Noviherbaspirillum humi TaxID=1688639 RepID=A0A239C619_9BURK|nr:hypothetical protein [Noviherbaspirillum humi]SNS15071.1 hypothetical protein SAMN06265795_101257 [Noviherbaspirillum humi]